ncbi:hypothetical protein NEUTE1DRAFT_134222 [Neurospora tetrasperma FGSC 2508]|uniref:ATP-grasp domain-containing protein n=1 Tax=Neurospora tetrasperma (strain FGSC 2508 / ATCC MYA-4615 / P0657) TaxID=510951 RepID=F8MAU5_NEUT8|nr:uncharacterized protein NEUTE1DRAFT_134222 [Neurospora tetrasperma FGSC 2508]EGO60163.1 hypothetical protein NEUTE1DRAFT_134222 [Neurospora tetrasperma FGSC 2508]EGZ75882.1 hypothetical protein NEUTE2DRAFT_126832 [Neurospora tetrasperma FGSC 2509]
MAQIGELLGLAPFGFAPVTSSSPMNNQSAGSNRPFFCDTVDLGDLYAAIHVVVLPPSPQASLSPGNTPNGSSKNPYNGHDGTNGHAQDVNGRPSTPTQLDKFLLNLISAGVDEPRLSDFDISLFTLIFPKCEGYAVRSNLLEHRLQDCPIPIARIDDRLIARKFHGIFWARELTAAGPSANLSLLAEHAAGVVQWCDVSSALSIQELQQRLINITQELHHRLHNVPCLLPDPPIEEKTVALVRGRPNLMTGGPVYAAAKALGLKLVIIDEAGHWLEANTIENRKLRKAFLRTDMTEDEGLADRIVQSIKRYGTPVDGIFTLSDNFFVTVAKVAEELGLPCGPVSAFETAVDKYKSRMLQDSPGHTARVTSVEELDILLSAPTDGSQPFFTPTFPMIVKPTKGWSSECVSKVTKLSDLTTAVKKATTRHGSAAVIEPFYDGPEIDVNFVLLDGEILFYEIADEPPCEGDATDATVNDTFSPVALTLPSALPADEQEIVKDTLHKILLDLGFHTGIYHLEARMVNSKYEYRSISPGIIDLVPRDNLPLSKNPECKLIEINARPPGYRVSVPSRHTYGIDYFAVRMLAALGDKDRLRAISVPFSHYSEVDDGTPGAGAQYWSRLVYIPVPRDGVLKWGFKQHESEHNGYEIISPSEDLKLRRPDLAGHIVLAVDYYEHGEWVSTFTDGARTYLGHVLVKSTVSRQEAIEVGNAVLKAYEVDIDIEGESDFDLLSD